MKRLSALPSILLLLFFGTIASPGWSQKAGDFQTKNVTGNWSDFTSWNVYNDGIWIPSSAALPRDTSSVFIQAGHTIYVDVADAVCFYLNITGDAASKIAFSSNTAILNIKGNMGLFSVSHNCFGTWATGAKIVFSGEGLQGFTNLSDNSAFINVEVNKPSGTLSSPSALRIDSALYLTAGTLNIPSASSLLLNGAALVSTGGILTSGTSADLAITGTTGGIVVLPLTADIAFRNIMLSGTRTLKMNGVNDIRLGAKFIIGDSATYDNGGESRIVDNGGPSINISGRFITRSVNGYRGTGAAIPGIDPVLDSGSTIEYGRLGDQFVQGSLPYRNVTFSGSGIKTPSSSFKPYGTLTITDLAILDATSDNIGDGTDSTRLTMNGGRLILGTTGTQPMMNGTYHLTGGVIQFANSGTTLQRIRSPKTYYAIEVTGTNVANSSGNIYLAPEGSFTVKSSGKFRINNRQITDSLTIPGTQTVIVEENATFECGSADGFSGGDGTTGNSTSINSRIETILLAPGSTVNYLRDGDQVITNQLAYQNLTISGTENKTAPPAIVTVEGNLSKAGTSSFLHNSGTVLLNGTLQKFAGLTYHNLILTNGGIKTTSGNSTIIDSIKVAASTTLNLAAGDSVFLHSDASKTARVGQVEGTITYNSNSKFVVERYISAKRAWRFLSVPVENSSATFHQTWQENQPQGSVNQTSPSGYGTQLTSNILPTALNGFDYYSANGASVKKYDPVNDKWTGINSTNDPIQTQEGLMTFVRGDRTAKGINAALSSTVLRTYGQLYTGEISTPGSGADKFTSIGNPFASAIDMRTIDRSNDIDSSVYIWDPNLTGQGFGAYQTFTYTNGAYIPVPGGGSYGASGSTYNLIASGQAFFVHGKLLGSGGQLIIKEKDKVYSDVSPGFRLAGTPDVQILRNNLYAIDKDSGAVLVDGVLNIIGDSYSNSVDDKDAVKILNFSENLSIKKEGKLLAVEKKHTITGRDTIFYNLANVKLISYRFEVIANALDDGYTMASFEDTWLKTATPVELNGTTLIHFTITSDSGSWNPGRFRLVFSPSIAVPLPILFSSVKAYQQNKDISVQWKVENEKNSKEYMVEKSINGRLFNVVNTVKAAGNNSGTNKYQWLDEKAVAGANYYRITHVPINGEIQYSAVVSVVLGKVAPQVLVNPNPITANSINVQLINQLKGSYSIKLLNTAGQVVAESLVNHEEGSSFETLQTGAVLARGVYWLKVIGKDKRVFTIKILK